MKDVVIISKYSHTIEYNLKTTLDASGLTKLQSELNGVSLKLQQMSNQELISDKSKTDALKTVTTVQKALTKAFNPKMGMLDLSQFQKGLNGLGLPQIQRDFYKIGVEGKAAFASLLGSIGKIDIGLKSTSNNLDKIKNTISNTVRWGVVSSAFNQIGNSLRDSVQYMKDLDDSLTQIMLVTDYSRENMNDFAKGANEAAKALGSTTTAMTNASLVFAQQGFNLDQSQQLAELSTKLANASQQDTSATSDQITAYMNAYGLDQNMAALSDALDAWAQVANVSAADVAELAQASQKAASTANTVGVSMDQLNAQIATIESVTREAPEQIGNGLKTLYARFSDLEAGNTLEDGVSLGKVTEQLEKYGVEVLDGEGKMRGVGDIMEDLMEVWSSLDQTQKAAVAQTVAGKYQLSRFESLMNRSDLYEQYKSSSENAEGTLDEMNQKYVDSLEGKMKTLQATLEGVFSSLFDSDDFYGMIDALTELVNLMDNFVQSIGGGEQALLALGSIGLKTFSKDIGANIGKIVYNGKAEKLQKEQIQGQRNSVLQQMGLGDIDKAEIEETVDYIDKSLSKSSMMTEDHIKQNNSLLKEQTDLTKKKIEAQEALNKAHFGTNAAYSLLGVDDVIHKEKDGSLNASGLEEQEKAGTILSNSEIKDLDWDSISSNILKANSELKIMEDRVKNLSTLSSERSIDTDSFYNDLNRLDSIFTDIKKETEGLTGPIADAKEEFDQLWLAAVEGGENFTTSEAQKYIDALKQKILSMIEAAKEAQKNGSNVVDAEELKRLEQVYKDLESQQEILNKKQSTFFKELDFSAAISNISQLTAATGDLIFGFQTLSNIGTIWDNEELTSGEKLLQTILALSSAVPMLAMGFTDMYDSSSRLMKQLKDLAINLIDAENASRNLAETLTTQETIDTAATEANSAAKTEKAAASTAAATAETLETKATSENTEEKVANTVTTETNTTAKVKGAEASAAVATAEVLVGDSAKAATPGILTMGKALLKAFWPFLAVGVVVGGIAAIFGALAAEYTKTERAAAEAAKQSKEAAKAFDAAKNTYDSFSSNADAYRDAKNALDDLEEGTKEWNDALDNVNQQVLDLLEKYPQLAEYITRGANGSLQISEEGLSTLDSQLKENASNAQMRLSVAKENEAAKSLEHSATELSRTVKAVETRTRKQLDNNPNIKARKYVEKEETREFPLTESEAQTILNEVKEKGSGVLSDTDQLATLLGKEATDPIIKAIQDSADKFVKAVNDSKNHKTAADIYAKEATQTKLESLGYDSNNEDNNTIVDLTSSYAQRHSKDNYDSYMNKSDEDIQRAYMENTGYSFDKKEGNTYQFKDAEGNAVPVTKEEMANLLSAADALDAAAAKLDSFAETAATLSVSDAAKTFDDTSMLTKTKEEGFNFSSLDNDDLNQIVGGKNTDAGGANRIIDTKNLGEYLGFDPAAFEEYAKNLGYSSADAYTKAFKEEFQRRQAEIVETDNLLTKGTKDGSAGVDTSTVDFDANSQEYQTQADNILKVIDVLPDLDKAFKNNRLTIDDYRKGLANLSKEYTDLRPLSQKLTSAQTKYNKIMKKSNKTEEEVTEATIELADAQAELKDAIASKELDKSRKKLQKYNNTLKHSATDSEDFKKASKGISKELKKLSGIDVKPEWVAENKEAIQEWLDGIEGAGAKLTALLNLDDVDSNFAQVMSNMGADYNAMREAIASNRITFNAEGFADFSQLNSELGIVKDVAHATDDELRELGSYLSALGGGALELTNDSGATMSIPAPPKPPNTSGMDASAAAEVMNEYSVGLSDWINQVSTALQQGWAFKGIDLPSDGPTVPTSSPSGLGKTGGGGGKGGGGKGGGGGGKKYTPKENKDPIDNKVDRYEKVNTALAAIGADYERIADEQDRLSGDKLFNNLQKQNDLIKKQIALHEEKLQIQKAELAEVQNQLQSGFGITFDSDGLMQNYAQVHQALINEVNRLNSQYSSVTSEAEEKALDAKVEAAEKRLSNFEELYQRYDDLLSSDLKDTIKQIEDLKDALEDLHIQAIRMTFEIADSIKEINEAVSVILTPKEVWFDENPLEKAKHLIGDIDKFFDDPTANDEYYDKQIKEKEEELSKTTDETRKKRLEQDIASLKESKEQQGKGTIDKAGSGYIDMLFGNADFSLQEIEEYKATGKSSVYGENGAALYEDALKNLTALASGIEELRSKVAELQATVDEAVSDAIEKCDELNHKYELINEDLEHQRDLVELVYGEKSFKEQRALIDAQIANNKAQIASQKRIIEEKKAMLATLDKDSEAYKNLKQSIEESESAVKDLTTSTVELQREAQKLATEEAISAMEKNFLGTDLEWAQTQWELINKQADMYLDDVNKAYNIQKLQNKYLNMLEKSNDLDIQQQITAQMDEQLDKLRKKTKLSEYDVQYANAQLDILQKKIALEEAQRNKSEMKLRRDSQGNYSYVYTANDADLSAAQDSLLDAENNAYNMSKEHMIQMNNEKYAALQDFFEKFRQIQNDITLSEEERTKRLQELQDANKEILNAISEQLGVSQENMLKDFSDITELILEENAGNLSDINEAIVNGNKDAMDQLDQRWTQSLDKIGKFGDAFSEKNKEVIEGLNTTLKGYETSVDEVASSVSGGFDTITESIKESQEATSNLNTETNALIESLQKTTGEIGKTQEKINGYITEIQLGNEKIEGLENTVKRLQAELLEEQRKRLLAEQAAANGNSSAAAGGGGGSATSNNGNAEIGDAVTYNGGDFWYSSNPLSGDPHGTTSAGSTVYITNVNPNGKYPYHISRGPHLGSGDLGWLSLSQLSGYDTGGYTGSWGESTFDNKNGKLAVLHQKELVLNATDTANILTAVSAVRDMAQIFKMNSLEGIASSISNSLNNYQTIPQLGQDVNQNVHITAEFPNVSSSAEIEQALLTLNDRAMQYAFKNR